jgi:hypothetical protein
VTTTVAIGALTLVWLALSVLNQFKRGSLIARVKRHDALALIPTWTFFAPRPGVTDFNVMYRDCTVSGGFSPWYEMRHENGGRFRAVWNPSKRVGKGITDTCNTLLQLSSKNLGRGILVQVPYLLLLNHVSAAPRTDASHMRQFAIVRTTGHDAPRDTTMLFVSALHRLERAS